MFPCFHSGEDNENFTALCLMSPNAKYFVGNKYKTLEEAKQAYIQKQEYWNKKNEETGFRTFNYKEVIQKNEEE